jgi:hypothetical protein
LHDVIQQYPQPFSFPKRTRIGVLSTRSATLFHALFQRAVDCIAPIATADSLEAAVHSASHQTYCWFTSRIAPARFATLGNRLTRIDLYDTIIPDRTLPVQPFLAQSDLVTMTSPSCVDNFVIRTQRLHYGVTDGLYGGFNRLNSQPARVHDTDYHKPPQYRVICTPNR